jgi:phosphate uptake regulator
MLNEIINLLKRDNLMVQALDECYEMVDLCRTMLNASITSLRESDNAEIALDIGALDKKLNAFERDVRRKVMTHLSLTRSTDISSGLILVSIVIDLERIGDYAKNIYQIAQAHPSRLNAGPIEDQVKEIETVAADHFKRSMIAFKEGDVEAARELMSSYKADISSVCADLERQLVAGEVDLPAAEAVAVALYLRFIKRISSHARNLVSAIVNPFPRIGYKEKTGK